MEAAKQPSIAIITSQYHEKMAVDAMMSNRQTFVRYATVGEYRDQSDVLCSNFVLCSSGFVLFYHHISIIQDCSPKLIFIFCLILF